MGDTICSDITLAKSEIDEQILYSERLSSHHAQRATNLKRRRNEITAVERLNDHVLLYIFTLLAHDPARTEDRWDWAVVTHVCRRWWRQIATSNRQIWSNIIIWLENLSRRKLEAHLVLSRNSILSVTILQRKGFDGNLLAGLDDKLMILAAHSERIKVLHIEVLENAWSVIGCVEKSVAHGLQKLTGRLVEKDPPATQSPFTEDILPTRVVSSKLLFSNSLKKAFFQNIRFHLMIIDDSLPMYHLCDLTFKGVTGSSRFNTMLSEFGAVGSSEM